MVDLYVENICKAGIFNSQWSSSSNGSGGGDDSEKLVLLVFGLRLGSFHTRPRAVVSEHQKRNQQH